LFPFTLELPVSRVAPYRVSAPTFPASADQILIRKVAEPGGRLSNLLGRFLMEERATPQALIG